MGIHSLSSERFEYFGCHKRQFVVSKLLKDSEEFSRMYCFIQTAKYACQCRPCWLAVAQIARITAWTWRGWAVRGPVARGAPACINKQRAAIYVN